MRILRHIYRALRSVLFSVILTVAGLYLLLYLVVSMPAVQDVIKTQAERELSRMFGSEVSIGRLEFSPFSQLVLTDVSVPEPSGARCIDVGRLGAGISLVRLLFTGEIVISYAEVIGLDAHIVQPAEGAPLNIDFIIKAFAPKDKNKPPTRFRLAIRNVVVRKCAATFDRAWIPRLAYAERIDFNHLAVSNLRMDVLVPELRDDFVKVELRRLALSERSGFELSKLAFKAEVSANRIAVSDMDVEMPNSVLRLDGITLEKGASETWGESLRRGNHQIALDNERITPYDLRCFYPPLKNVTDPIMLTVNASGNTGHIDVAQLLISAVNENIVCSASGYISGLPADIHGALDEFRLHLSRTGVERILAMAPQLPGGAVAAIEGCGSLDVNLTGTYAPTDILSQGRLATDAGELTFDAAVRNPGRKDTRIVGSISTEGLDCARILPDRKLGFVALSAEGDVTLGGKLPLGEASLNVTRLDYNGYSLHDISAYVRHDGAEAEGNISSADPALLFSADARWTPGNGAIAGVDNIPSALDAVVSLERFCPGSIGLLPKMPDAEIRGVAEIRATGHDINSLQGVLTASDAAMELSDGRSLPLRSLRLESNMDDEGVRHLHLASDYADAQVEGVFQWTDLRDMALDIAHPSQPEFIPMPVRQTEDERIDFSLAVRDLEPVCSFFNIGVCPLAPVMAEGTLDSGAGLGVLSLSAPAIRNGKKRIRDTKLRLDISRQSGSALALSTLIPGKKGAISLEVDATAFGENSTADIRWEILRDNLYDGTISLGLNVEKSAVPGGKPAFLLSVEPSVFHINNAEWKVAPARITYRDDRIDVPRLLVSHDNQFVNIAGVAGVSPDDRLEVNLSDVDLGYVFETLNINYVTFFGSATGRVEASQLLSGVPVAHTDGLRVKGFGYNDVVLGTADLTSAWDHEEKRVGIRADIADGPGHFSVVDGGVWVTRDSLSFDLDAKGIKAGFIQPFMATFCSGLEGRASGKLKLFGTFKDIDLTGAVRADSLRMKLGYTNCWYSGSDSVIFKPGRVTIPSFRVYDRNGRSGVFSGELRHTYFRDAYFDFRLRDARDMLCYDTDARINPDWYGTVYGSGSVSITGAPGRVDMIVDMTTRPGSAFTFVLSETEAAEDFNFLNFTDRRKEEAERLLHGHRQRGEEEAVVQPLPASAFNLDLRASVTPDAKVVLVMDPTAGDKITAYGSGALTLGYASENDDITIYGSYTLDKGVYNFSLQDLILKDFNIKAGSTISFNGDPMQALLNISAAYRVNTNLADLDKSFSTDRELNRTNVPVEAILNVRGDLQSPDIDFDIELPTLTSDMQRKVRSIISTDDMMSRQIIYLLALNRFYTPEYMNATGNGGELASVASSTISSQIQNVLSQLTDKMSIAPSFRTDKGDFSDMEVDLALSSSLLNNRLLINGNFGYRDRSTSSTTFIGDFDIEYLLNRSGNLRLKAYNHYNDQNYYLKSALTTQGIGVLYRRDFDRIFNFLRRKRKAEAADSIN